MRKAIGITCAVVVSLFPASIALADEGGSGSVEVDTSGVVQSRRSNPEFRVNANVGVGTSSRGRDADDASSSPETRGEKEGLLKRFGTTTPPGFFFDDRGRDTEARATSTEGRRDGAGGPRQAGIRGFFSWLLGLPGTTTVQDIRVQLGATTTASTTVEAPPQGVAGFFRGFLKGVAGFFGRGRED